MTTKKTRLMVFDNIKKHLEKKSNRFVVYVPSIKTVPDLAFFEVLNVKWARSIIIVHVRNKEDYFDVDGAWSIDGHFPFDRLPELPRDVPGPSPAFRGTPVDGRFTFTIDVLGPPPYPKLWNLRNISEDYIDRQCEGAVNFILKYAVPYLDNLDEYFPEIFREV